MQQSTLDNVYLDYSATTYVDKKVKKAMDTYFSEDFGNPGSMHSFGLKAGMAVKEARESIAKIVGSRANEIIFTGSGTESINLAIQGVAKALKSKGKHIIASSIEHHAVTETLYYLEKEEGYKVTYLDVDEKGLVNLEELEKAITPETVLVSIMYANNEIGTVQDIAEISKITKKHKVLLHTDACQAAGLLDINVDNLGVDLMTINGGKIYGPKGVGMLYVRLGTAIKPLIYGGGQERGLRSGTENVPGIVGFAKALELCDAEKESESKRLTVLRDKMIKEILEKIPKSILNGHAEKRLPNNVNLSFLDVEGEAVLLYLNEYNIFASTGSACTSKTLDPSHVILALGLPYEAAHGSIRFSLGRKTTEKEIDRVVEVLPEIVQKLREISPVNLAMKDVEVLKAK